ARAAERCPSAAGARPHPCLAREEADGRLAEGKEGRRDEPTEPYVSPADLRIGHVLKEQGKHESQDEERDGKRQQTAQEGLVGALKQGGSTRKGGADDKRDEE